MTEQIRIISPSVWLFKKKSVPMHGNMNVKNFYLRSMTEVHNVTVL